MEVCPPTTMFITPHDLAVGTESDNMTTMVLRSGKSNVTSHDWKEVTADEIKLAISSIAEAYSLLSREELDSWKRECCMDDFRNQTGNCNCISRLNKMITSTSRTGKRNYELICRVITDWFHGAAVMERRLNCREISKLRFNDSFRKTIVLKRSTKGTYTRMIDMSVPPNKETIEEAQYTDDVGIDLYENLVVSEYTLCLNSVLHLWCKIAGGNFGARSGDVQFRRLAK